MRTNDTSMDDADAHLNRVELATRLNADSIRELQHQLGVVSQQVQQLVQIRADAQARAARQAAYVATLPSRRGGDPDSDWSDDDMSYRPIRTLATTSVVDQVFAAHVRG